MLAWILNTKAEKSGVEGIHHAAGPCSGAGAAVVSFKKLLQERLHAEVGQGRAEEHRGELAVAHLLQVEVVARAVDAAPRRPAASRTGGRRWRLAGPRPPGQKSSTSGPRSRPALPDRQAQTAAPGGCSRSYTPLKVLARANGPVHGVGADAKLLLNLVQQVVGVLGTPGPSC